MPRSCVQTKGPSSYLCVITMTGLLRQLTGGDSKTCNQANAQECVRSFYTLSTKTVFQLCTFQYLPFAPSSLYPKHHGGIKKTPWEELSRYLKHRCSYMTRDPQGISSLHISPTTAYLSAVTSFNNTLKSKQLPGEARVSLSDDELCLFRLLRFSRPPRGDDEVPAKHGSNSASSPDPSVSSSVKMLSRESEIRTATPGFANPPNPNLFLSNKTFRGSEEWHSGTDCAVASATNIGSLISVSVGSHSDIIVARMLIRIVQCTVN